MTGKATLKRPSLLSVAALVARAEAAQQVRSGVYFLIRNHKVIYVGKTIHIDARVARHAQYRQFDSWTWLPCAVEDLEKVERAYLNALLPEGNLDPTTLRLKGGSPWNLPPIPENPWANVTAESWNAIAADDHDDDKSVPTISDRRIEWMRRLRAMKADPSIALADFGVSPFSDDWSPKLT